MSRGEFPGLLPGFGVVVGVTADAGKGEFPGLFTGFGIVVGG